MNSNKPNQPTKQGPNRAPQFAFVPQNMVPQAQQVPHLQRSGSKIYPNSQKPQLQLHSNSMHRSVPPQHVASRPPTNYPPNFYPTGPPQALYNRSSSSGGHSYQIPQLPISKHGPPTFPTISMHPSFHGPGPNMPSMSSNMTIRGSVPPMYFPPNARPMRQYPLNAVQNQNTISQTNQTQWMPVSLSQIHYRKFDPEDVVPTEDIKPDKDITPNQQFHFMYKIPQHCNIPPLYPIYV